MSSTRRPWYPWYPNDFNGDEKVKCLPPLAELIYRRALDLMWQSNSIRIPSAMPLLLQSLGSGIEPHEFELMWERIQYPDFELFKTEDDGKWVYSQRLRKEAENIKALSEKKKKAGKTGAKARWGKQKIADAKQTHSKRIADAKQTDSHSYSYTDITNNPPNPPKGGNEYSQSFESWWKAYPKKVGKDAAYRSWKKIGKKKSATPTLLMDSIKAQIKADHFAGKNGDAFIPNPSTWLNQGRWMDEIKKPTQNKPTTQSTKFRTAEDVHELFD